MPNTLRAGLGCSCLKVTLSVWPAPWVAALEAHSTGTLVQTGSSDGDSGGADGAVPITHAECIDSCIRILADGSCVLTVHAADAAVLFVEWWMKEGKRAVHCSESALSRD